MPSCMFKEERFGLPHRAKEAKYQRPAGGFVCMKGGHLIIGLSFLLTTEGKQLAKGADYMMFVVNEQSPRRILVCESTGFGWVGG